MPNGQNKIRSVYRLLVVMCACALFFQYLTGYGPEAEKRLEAYRSMIKHTVPVITPRQLHNMLSKPSAPVLLDTRQAKEYNISHLPEARFVGYRQFTINMVKDLPKKTQIVLYCSLGVRSEKIALKLKKAGYTNVKNLLGGLFEWVNLDYPVYDLEERPTPMVHCFSKKWGKWLLKGKKTYK